MRRSIKLHKSGSFRIQGQRFIYSRARLYEDRLELTAWGWLKYYRCRIPVDAIEAVIWWTGDAHANLELCLRDGKRLGLWMVGAALWKFAIDRLCDTVRPLTPLHAGLEAMCLPQEVPSVG